MMFKKTIIFFQNSTETLWGKYEFFSFQAENMYTAHEKTRLRGITLWDSHYDFQRLWYQAADPSGRAV